jgi:hypothetical protein
LEGESAIPVIASTRWLHGDLIKIS